MSIVDRLEKIGRLILWLSLSLFCVAVPLGLRAQAKETARAAEQARADAEKARAVAEKQKASAGCPAPS